MKTHTSINIIFLIYNGGDKHVSLLIFGVSSHLPLMMVTHLILVYPDKDYVVIEPKNVADIEDKHPLK